MTWEMRRGDCVELMRELPEESVDSVVADPPYGIGFMGHEWDQPGKFGALTANGRPGVFVRPTDRREPPGQRRRANPAPSGFGTMTEGKRRKMGKRAVSRVRDGAMEAGRYDLSWEANRRFQAWCEEWAIEALRVLKPGGHAVVFGGTRTYHRLASGLEDAGFEIRDGIASWIFGSGFPKSLNVGKAIDSALGAEREVIGLRGGRYARGYSEASSLRGPGGGEVTAPATPEAERWEGWGTALKPAWEPIVVARKPFKGNVAGNVLEHGTAALNIDACRVDTGGEELAAPQSDPAKRAGVVGSDMGFTGSDAERFQQAQRESIDRTNALGRWPANVLMVHSEDCVLVGERRVRGDGHFPAARGPSGYGSAVEESNGGGLKGQEDLEERHLDDELVQVWACVPGCPVRALDDQAGELRSGANPSRRNGDKFRSVYGDFAGGEEAPARGLDVGGASRFFYCAKASRAERGAGLAEHLPRTRDARKRYQQDAADRWVERALNRHPTVKPIDLMRWLVRLVTPPGGLVLDPFAGSGTTGCAAVLEGFEFVGLEREGEYVEAARARVRFWQEHPTGLPAEVALRRQGDRARVRASGQLGFELA